MVLRIRDLGDRSALPGLVNLWNVDVGCMLHPSAGKWICEISVASNEVSLCSLELHKTQRRRDAENTESSKTFWIEARSRSAIIVLPHRDSI